MVVVVAEARGLGVREVIGRAIEVGPWNSFQINLYREGLEARFHDFIGSFSEWLY